jgi:SAM-dependent methyltransferase
MQSLSACPACGCEDLRDVNLATNLSPKFRKVIGDTAIWEADYASCPRCDLIFARNRQEREEIDAYYNAFPIIEHRDYVTWPLPQQFIDQQNAFCDRLVGNLEKADLIRPDMSVLNLRCEYGVHLARLRDAYGVTRLYGLDHFATNLRYGREVLGLANLDLLSPYLSALPFGDMKFDLILANHLMTHALDPMGLLQILKDRLAPGGAILFYNELDHVALMDEPKLFKRGVISYHKQLLAKPSLDNMLRLSGFDTEWIDYDPVGFKWASGRQSRTVVGRPAEAIDVSEVTTPDGESLYEAYEKGLARHGKRGLLHSLKRMLVSERLPA